MVGETNMATTLTLEQEAEFIKRIRSGNKEAFDEFVLKNENLVFLVLRRYKFFYCEGLTQEDLIQEGYLGLIKAVQNFDNSEGFKFSTYAMKVINGYILRAIRKHSNLIKVPEFQRTNIKKLLDEKKVGLSELFNEVSHEGFDKNLLYALSVLQSHVFSLDAQVNEEGQSNTRYADILPDDTSVDARQHYSDDEILKKITSVLDERELTVVQSALGINAEKMKLSEIGKVVGLTRERVRQIFNKALEKIAIFLKEDS